MPVDSPPNIDCESHGLQFAAVVCGQMLAAGHGIGFVENSSDPSDLQAWCHACEALFLREDSKTETFLRFNKMTVVCADCYAEFKARELLINSVNPARRMHAQEHRVQG